MLVSSPFWFPRSVRAISAKMGARGCGWQQGRRGLVLTHSQTGRWRQQSSSGDDNKGQPNPVATDPQRWACRGSFQAGGRWKWPRGTRWSLFSTAGYLAARLHLGGVSQVILPLSKAVQDACFCVLCFVSSTCWGSWVLTKRQLCSPAQGKWLWTAASRGTAGHLWAWLQSVTVLYKNR